MKDTKTELIDLSIATLATACKGNVKLLPSFMVHDNPAWPPGKVQLDNKNRIHVRRSTFLQAICPQVPTKAGIWLGPDVQEFFIDIQPHHLQGSDSMEPAKGHAHSRAITLTDAAGRNPGDEGYGTTLPVAKRVEKSDRDDLLRETDGQIRGVGSVRASRDRK